MNNNELQKILTLFSLVILIDDKVLKVEVDTLGRQLSQLYSSLGEGYFITESMGVDWFHANRASLTSILSSPNKENYIKSLLTQLSDSSLKLKIYDVIIRIAHADAEFHPKEEEIAKLASFLWNLDLGLWSGEQAST